MKPKNYTAQQVAELAGKTYEALVKQLQRDLLKPAEKRAYPHAYKFNRVWVIPERDLR